MLKCILVFMLCVSFICGVIVKFCEIVKISLLSFEDIISIVLYYGTKYGCPLFALSCFLGMTFGNVGNNNGILYVVSGVIFALFVWIFLLVIVFATYAVAKIITNIMTFVVRVIDRIFGKLLIIVLKCISSIIYSESIETELAFKIIAYIKKMNDKKIEKMPILILLLLCSGSLVILNIILPTISGGFFPSLIEIIQKLFEGYFTKELHGSDFNSITTFILENSVGLLLLICCTFPYLLPISVVLLNRFNIDIINKDEELRYYISPDKLDILSILDIIEKRNEQKNIDKHGVSE